MKDGAVTGVAMRRGTRCLSTERIVFFLHHFFLFETYFSQKLLATCLANNF